MLTKNEVNSILENFYKLREPIDNRILEIVEICKKYFKFGECNFVTEDCKAKVNFIIEEINTKHENEFIYMDLLPVYRFRDEFNELEKINAFFIDKNGNLICVNRQIPIRWLWEDFEQEIINGIKKYKNRNIVQLNEYIESRDSLESIKLKLSQKECELLEVDKKLKNVNSIIDRMT